MFVKFGNISIFSKTFPIHHNSPTYHHKSIYIRCRYTVKKEVCFSFEHFIEISKLARNTSNPTFTNVVLYGFVLTGSYRSQSKYWEKCWMNIRIYHRKEIIESILTDNIIIRSERRTWEFCQKIVYNSRNLSAYLPVICIDNCRNGTFWIDTFYLISADLYGDFFVFYAHEIE